MSLESAGRGVANGPESVPDAALRVPGRGEPGGRGDRAGSWGCDGFSGDGDLRADHGRGSTGRPRRPRVAARMITARAAKPAYTQNRVHARREDGTTIPEATPRPARDRPATGTLRRSRCTARSALTHPDRDCRTNSATRKKGCFRGRPDVRHAAGDEHERQAQVACGSRSSVATLARTGPMRGCRRSRANLVQAAPPPVDEREGDDGADGDLDATSGLDARAGKPAGAAMTNAVASAAPAARRWRPRTSGRTETGTRGLEAHARSGDDCARAVVTNAAATSVVRRQEDERATPAVLGRWRRSAERQERMAILQRSPCRHRRGTCRWGGGGRRSAWCLDLSWYLGGLWLEAELAMATPSGPDPLLVVHPRRTS